MRDSHGVVVMGRRRGFSLIELLITIAVVGILAALGTPLYRDWQNQTATREGAVRLARAVDRARTEAKITGASVTLSAPAPGDSSSFDLDGQTIALPPLVEVTTGAAVTFSPPFGTQNLAEIAFVVSSIRDGSVARTVRVVGILGKVVVE